MGSDGKDRHLHVLLLAGGSGTRFWPLSRAERPKQMIALTGKRSLLEETWKRVRKLVPASRIWVVAPARLTDQITERLPQLDRERLIVEPTPRDTGPAVGLACATVALRDPKAVTAIFPTDHVIEDTDTFVKAVRTAVAAARKRRLVCLGIRPDRPATGFGYLRCAETPRRGRATPVRRFVEKPDLAKARRFVKSGRYLWNGGMFVWSAERFLEEMERTAPKMYTAVTRAAGGREASWKRAPRLSVDYAVMEHARDVEVVPLDAGWDDVGSWDAAVRLQLRDGGGDRNAILVDSDGSAVFGDGRLIAVVDVPDVAIVDTEDALLVVSRRSAERVKQVIAEVKKRGRKDLL